MSAQPISSCYDYSSFSQQPMYSHGQRHFAHRRTSSRAGTGPVAVGAGAAGLIGGAMLAEAWDDHQHWRPGFEGFHGPRVFGEGPFVDEVRSGMFGTERIIEETRPGLFGTEQIIEDVRTDMFGDTEIRREVIDRDVWGGISRVREETIDQDMFGTTTIERLEDW